MNDLSALVRRAVALGADEARPIDPRQVKTAPWVRVKCQYGCPAFGTRLTCPPYSPTPQSTRRVLDSYRQGLVLHSRGGARSLREAVVRLERESFLSGYYKALGLAAGPCGCCERCSLEACRHPDLARPSMEACGIDVFATVRALGWPIEVVRDRAQPRNYYALLLLE